MTKNLFLIKKIWTLILASMILVAFMPLLFLSKNNFSSASSTSLTGTFTSIVKDSNNQEIEPEYEDQLKIYDWREAKEIVLQYLPNEDVESDNYYPPNTDQGNAIYTLSVTLEYLKGYADAVENFENNNTKVYNLYNRENLTPDNIFEQIFVFNINKGITISASDENSAPTHINGWGIYRFKIIINNAEKYSDYIFIKPNNNIITTPTIAYNIVPSSISIHNAFEFYISNSDVYRYSDTNRIKWYVRGESETGDKYVLTKEDAQSERFNSEGIKYLWENIPRNGLTFLFDDNNITGKWEVWCEFSREDETFAESEFEDIETILPVDVSWVIYVVIGAGLASIVGVISISVYRNKKEKIW